MLEIKKLKDINIKWITLIYEYCGCWFSALVYGKK